MSPSNSAASPRRHSLRVLIALLGALLLCGLCAGAAHARSIVSVPTITPSTPVTPGSGYVALGDSVTFGYMEPTVVPTPDYADAANFDAYPQMLGSELHLKVANLACPGETSGSLIDAGAQSNGCENVVPGSTGPAYRVAYPLHVHYRGAQLQEAVKYIRANSDVRLVSLMIGANDLFICQKLESGCLTAAEAGPYLAHITRNVHTILSTLRNRAHYHGQIVLVDYYSLDYASPLVNAFSTELNTAQAAGAKGMHVRFANAFRTFGLASVHSGDDTCTAGLLTQLGAPTTCGVHPSVAGQALLASTVENAIRIR